LCSFISRAWSRNSTKKLSAFSNIASGFDVHSEGGDGAVAATYYLPAPGESLFQKQKRLHCLANILVLSYVLTAYISIDVLF
jgi:hypothetical protein